MELNKVLLIGNLTHDPEPVRYLQSGTGVGKLRLASNRRYSGRDGDKREEVLYIDVEVWGKLADLCTQYLQKGSQVLVEGRLKMDTFQTQQGENRTKYLIVADNVRFGARPGDGGGQQGGGGSFQRGGGQQRGGGRPANDDYNQDFSGGYDDAPSSSSTEDDLPF